MSLPKILMLFLLSKCLATQNTCSRNPYGPMIISGLKHRFPKFPVDFHVNPWHDGWLGRRSHAWQADTVRWRTGGPPDSQSHHSRCAAAMAHGSESCCPDENDETMDEDGHFQGVLQFQTNTKDGSDGPCSKMEKG